MAIIVNLFVDTGLVEFQEFLFLLQLTCCDETKVADAAFKVLDPTGEGVITIDSLKKACTNIGVEISEDEITTLVKEADPEGTGALDFQGIQVKSMQRSGTEAIRTQKQNGKYLILQIVKVQREHMFNRVSSYFTKGGHSATEAELKIV